MEMNGRNTIVPKGHKPTPLKERGSTVTLKY